MRKLLVQSLVVTPPINTHKWWCCCGNKKLFRSWGGDRGGGRCIDLSIHHHHNNNGNRNFNQFLNHSNNIKKEISKHEDLKQLKSSNNTLLPNIKIPKHVQENLKFNEVQFYKLIEKHHEKELNYIAMGSLIGFSLIAITLIIYYLQDNIKDENSLKFLLEKDDEINHEKILNILKWLKLNNRDGIELLRNYLPKIIEKFSQECVKQIDSSKLITELTSLIYFIVKCEKNSLQSSDMEQVRKSIYQLIENGFKFTTINVNESIENILNHENFENIQFSGFINIIKIAEELDIKININDIEKTILNLNNRNLILNKLQNDYETRIGESLEKIQRGIEISKEETEYMKKLENKYENPNANSESFFLTSLIMELYKKQNISRQDLKNNSTVMNFLRREFKGNNHLSYIPSGYLLVELDDIPKDSIFNSRLPSMEKEQVLKINNLRTDLIKLQHDNSVLDKQNFRLALENFKIKAEGTYIEPFVEYLIISNFGFTGEIEVMKKEVLLYDSINHQSNCGQRDINILFELGNTLLQRNELGKAFQIFSQIQNAFPLYSPLKSILIGICKPSNFKVLEQHANISNMLLTLDKWDVCYKLRLTIQKSSFDN